MFIFWNALKTIFKWLFKNGNIHRLIDIELKRKILAF